MKRFLLSLLVFPLAVLSADFELLKNGQAKTVICAPESMDETLAWFNAEFSKCSGQKFTVVRENKSGSCIEFLMKTESDLLAQSKFSVSFPSRNIMRVEATPLSARFALNWILRQAGVRYPLPGDDGAYYPRIANLSVPDKPMVHEPGFRAARVLFSDDVQWHLNLNAAYMNSHELMNHNIHVIFPPEIYKDQVWSDKLWPLKSGKRVSPEKFIWDPCFSSQAAVDEAVKNVCAYFEKNPGAKTFSLGHNDGYNTSCECGNCRQANTLEQIPGYAAEYQKRNHWTNDSEVYFHWVNQVAEGVLQKFPDKYFGVLVYTSTLFPPTFKLNDRVIPVICTEAYAHTDPAVRAFWEELLANWSTKAENVGIWEYGYGLPYFSLPHVGFKPQSDWMKFVAAKNGAIGFVETCPSFTEGAKRYLYLRLFDEPGLDANSELNDWCRAAVGKDAAPFLKEYYDFWEKFWTERAVNTRWFQESKFSHYTAMVPDGGYLDALKKGDIKYCRQVMEKMLAAAKKSGDAGQQKRAAWLMTEFEFYEAGVYRSGVEITGGSGSLNLEQATELAQNLPQILHYAGRRAEITEQMLKTFPTWWGGRYPYLRQNIERNFGKSEFPEVLMQLAPHLENTKVKEIFDRQIAQVQVMADWKNLLNMLADLGSGKIKNIVPDGSFEQGKGKWIAMGDISTEQAFSGKQSFRFIMPRPKKGEMTLKVPMQPRRNHWLSFKVYLDKDYPPGRAKAYAYILGMNDKNVGSNYYIPPRVELIPGKWITVTTSANPGACAGSGNIFLIVEDMEEGDAVYVDDVLFTEIGNTATPPAAPMAAPKTGGSFARWTITDIAMRGEMEKYVKVESEKLTLKSDVKQFYYFSPDAIAAADGKQVKISFKISGKGTIHAGFFAYEGTGWKQVGGNQRAIVLKDAEQSIELALPVSGNAGSIRPMLLVAPNTEATLGDYRINVEN